MVDSFIGSTFGKVGQACVVGWHGQKRGRNKLYTVKCKICAEDPELFGDGLFLSAKGDLVSGQLPCGCGRSPRLDESQFIIKINRECASRGYSFLGFAEEYKGVTTRMNLRCSKDGHEWSSCSMNNFFRDRGCPLCGKVVKWTKEERESQICASLDGTGYKFAGWIGEFLGSRKSKIRINCVKHGEYSASLLDFLDGCRCPLCSKTGFDRTMPASLYVLVAEGLQGDFTGFGISNKVKDRISKHRARLCKEGYFIGAVRIFNLSGEAAFQLERQIKRSFKITPQKIQGFITEATSVSNYSAVIKFVEDFISDPSSLTNPHFVV